MDAYAHKADKSKVNIGSVLTAPDAPQNADEFYFDYQNGKYGFNTDPERGSSTFHPFNKGAILIGEYSANATIDVSALGATSASQFLAVCDTSTTAATSEWDHGDNIRGGGTYTPPTLSLSNGTLTLTIGSLLGGVGHAGSWNNLLTTTVNLPCKVYYVGDIESAS